MDFKDHVELHNGAKMPIVGLGTWQATKPEEIKVAVDTALKAGYRHIDTAYVYQNEEPIGEVLEEWINRGKIKREELFIVTKLPMIGNRASDVEKFLRLSLQKLRLTYVDLYLIHVPIGLGPTDDLNNLIPKTEDGKLILDKTTDHLAIWKAMEDQVDAGRTKAIGLSNFNSVQIERIMNNCRIKPANLQVEMHAYFQQKQLRKVCEKHGITVCAYAPLGSPGRVKYFAEHHIKSVPTIPDVMEHPVVKEIAKKYGKNPAQVLIRHLAQQQIVVIPKSSKPERIVSNFQIFDFNLSDEDMKRLNDLDQGPSARTFKFDNYMGWQEHPEFPYHIEY